MSAYQPIEDTVCYLTGTRRSHPYESLGEKFDLPATPTHKRSPRRLARLLFIFAFACLL
jgi:hypothetical protein